MSVLKEWTATRLGEQSGGLSTGARSRLREGGLVEREVRKSVGDVEVEGVQSSSIEGFGSRRLAGFTGLAGR
jgi:hypothetical protein